MSAAVLPCSFSRLYPTQSLYGNQFIVVITDASRNGGIGADAARAGLDVRCKSRFLGRRANSGGVGKAGKRGIGWEREKAAGSLLDVYKSVCTGNGDSTISSMHGAPIPFSLLSSHLSSTSSPNTTATCNLSPNMGSPLILDRLDLFEPLRQLERKFLAIYWISSVGFKTTLLNFDLVLIFVFTPLRLLYKIDLFGLKMAAEGGVREIWDSSSHYCF
ncbi:hypothetical protein R3P38DRAFT_2780821 [Favolaschia claudopus]|uniref:Uncharacterized protein n=1 Tax=Favolaschia claudopus TaxID=2862362 RepID=A0AAW0B812_9AGAR